MCGVITINDYRRLAANQQSGYTITAEYTNEAGQTAITVKDPFGDTTNIYKADGTEYDISMWRLPKNMQAKAAAQAMQEHGFTNQAQITTAPITTGPITTDGNGNTVETPEEIAAFRAEFDAAVAADPTTITVQGRTLAQWAEEGDLNENRDQDQHVHPEPPTGKATGAEMLAFINSLTFFESIVFGMQKPRKTASPEQELADLLGLSSLV